MKKLIVLIACLLLSSVVLADNVNPTVSFNVTDGEPEAWDPYVCNVGMRHVDGGVNICRHIETRETCTVADGNIPTCCADDPTKCECTTSQGRFMLDFIRFADLNSDINSEILNSSFDPNSPLNMVFSGNYDGTIPMFDATPYPVIAELEYNLSSELFGAEYFLDVCYPTPGECKAVTYDKTYIQSTDFIGGKYSYADLAHPNIKIQQVGGSTNCLSGVINQPMYSSAMVNVIDEGSPVVIDGGSSGAPAAAGCVIRFSFDETNTLAMRNWLRHDQTYKIKIRSQVEDTCGCSRTQGYWKTHANPAKKNYDETWTQIPEGVPTLSQFNPDANENAIFFDGSSTVLQILTTDSDCGSNDGAYGSAYRCLGKQWVASTLNLLAGAPEGPIATQWAQAQDILIAGPGVVFSTPEEAAAARANLLLLKTHLDSYNNGLLDGISHCDDGDKPEDEPEPED